MRIPGSIRAGATVNTSINTSISPPADGLYVGGSGHINVALAGDGTILLLTSLAAGVWHPVQVKTIYTSGTTATNVVYGRI